MSPQVLLKQQGVWAAWEWTAVALLCNQGGPGDLLPAGPEGQTPALGATAPPLPSGLHLLP